MSQRRSRLLLSKEGENWTSSVPPPAKTPLHNATGYFTDVGDTGDVDGGLTDMQTLILACFATLIPLVLILLTAVTCRYLWRKSRKRKENGYEGVLEREESSDPLGGKSLSASGNILTDELRTSESQFSVTPAEELDELGTHTPLHSEGAYSNGLPNHMSKSTNGSIITMTLKNNHLIVETEERGALINDGTIKTMTKFTPISTPDENNVFVVEVQHGIPNQPSSSCYDGNNSLYPTVQPTINSSQEDFDESEEDRSSSQRAQIHQPPDIDIDDISEGDELEDVEEEDEDDEDGGRGTEDAQCASTNTGLSQSDLSMSSAGSNNPSYRYGNQLGYDSGHFGYPQETGYSAGEDTTTYVSLSVSSFSKQQIVGHTITPQAWRPSIDSTIEEGLLSDIQLKQEVRRMNDKEEEVLQEEQRRLGNGPEQTTDHIISVHNGDDIKMIDEESDINNSHSSNNKISIHSDKSARDRTGSLPPVTNLGDIKIGKAPLSTVEELSSFDSKNENHIAEKKRGSLPIINTEIYTQMKQTKNIIVDKTTRPSSSPKFEKLSNENSPLDEVKGIQSNGQDMSKSKIMKSIPEKYEQKIVQEYENKGFVSTDQATN